MLCRDVLEGFWGDIEGDVLGVRCWQIFNRHRSCIREHMRCMSNGYILCRYRSCLNSSMLELPRREIQSSLSKNVVYFMPIWNVLSFNSCYIRQNVFAVRGRQVLCSSRSFLKCNLL